MRAAWTALLAVSILSTALVQAQDLSQLDAYATQLAAQRVFAGMVHVDQGGSTVFSKGFGRAVYELDVSMGNDHMYPVGSNTKLFTAVAVWQLHKVGKLSVYEPVSKYMNSSELGLTGPWCPRAHNTSKSAPCQTPQLQQLLRMSGGVLGFDNCAYPPNAWQQQYCLTGPLLGAGLGQSITNLLAAEEGALSLAYFLRLSGVLNMPLDFKPGTSYHYSNPAYTLAGYVVEKVSGMPLADYFRIHIFNKAGLSSTVYDVTNGILGLHMRQLPYPAYITYLAPGSTTEITTTAGVNLSQYIASSGDAAFWGGDFSDKTTNSATNKTLQKGGSPSLSAEAEDEGVHYAFTAKYPGPSNLDWNLANAAGAILSTPQDMTKWFRALLVDPDHLGLGKKTLKEMLGLYTVVPGIPSYNGSNGADISLRFSQGLVVVPVQNESADARGLGISHAYYLGSLGGFQAVVYMSIHPSDPSKDIFVNALAATVLPAPHDWPASVSNLTGAPQCTTHLSDNSSTGGGSSSSSSGSGSNSSSNGRRLLRQEAIWPRLAKKSLSSPRKQGTSSSGKAEVSLSQVLCELSNNMPAGRDTVPDLLTTMAVEGLTGGLWFGIHL